MSFGDFFLLLLFRTEYKRERENSWVGREVEKIWEELGEGKTQSKILYEKKNLIKKKKMLNRLVYRPIS